MFRVIVPKTFWYVDKNVKLKRERVFYLWARKKAQGNQNPERKKTQIVFFFNIGSKENKP